jgi:uncharacterized membrane-anchored protein
MDQLDAVRAAAPDLIAMTRFADGNRYADFEPGTDTMAAVGIGGLVAGTVAAAKPGLVVAGLLFLKKGFVLLLIPLAWLRNRVFGRRKAAAPAVAEARAAEEVAAPEKPGDPDGGETDDG